MRCWPRKFMFSRWSCLQQASLIWVHLCATVVHVSNTSNETHSSNIFRQINFTSRLLIWGVQLNSLMSHLCLWLSTWKCISWLECMVTTILVIFDIKAGTNYLVTRCFERNICINEQITYSQVFLPFIVSIVHCFFSFLKKKKKESFTFALFIT